MTLVRLWAFLAVALPVLASLIANLPTVDLAYHVRAGGLAIDGGAIPTTDSFTFTAAGQAWLNQQWGAQVALAAAHRLAGWTGLVLLRAALVGLTFGLVFLAARQRGATVRVAAGLTLGAFVLSAVTLGLRPQLFGMALFALTLLLVVGRRSSPLRIWLVVPVVLLWANVHGSFFLGIGLLGLAWLEDLHDRVAAPHRALAVAVAAAAASLLNPFGIGVWQYATGISTNPLVTGRITEWQPTSLRSPEGLAFYASALLVAALLARRARPTPWPALLWLAAFFGIAAFAVRGLAWWPLVAAVVVAGLLAGPAASPASEAGLRGRDRPRRVNLAVAGAIVVAGIGLLPAWRPVDPDLGAPAGVVGTAPPGITAALRGIVEPGDRLFNPQPWGSWFELALPGTPVFVDSRIELFPPAVWDGYDAVTDGLDGWAAELDRWGVTIVVAADRLGRIPLAGRLAADPAWREVHADADGRVFVRADR